MGDIDDDEEDTRRSLYIFGRDVSKIPCFRESFLYGIGGGVVTGLATFMRTSKPQLSCNGGVAAFTLITMAYWSVCRYKWSKDKFLIAQIQEGMRRDVMYQGTDLHRKIREEFDKESKEA